MRPGECAVGGIVFLALTLLMALLAPLSGGYQNVEVDTCGSSDVTPCHGVIDPSVVVTIDGPDVVETSSPVTYVITVTGGPSVTYGYFVVFTDPDGRSSDSLGDVLFHVEPNSITRVGETNTFVLEFTPPRYAVDLTMKVSSVSADNSLNPDGDGWNFAIKDVEVEYPVSSEFPGLGISSSIYALGASIVLIGFLMWIIFLGVERRVKKEVAHTEGGGREGKERDE
ncbi:MAG: hypothetical protein LN417_10575, partial [Candidatus Thermoplasmatota archaeon]|nr:hypothetical protein [Candidatus Thermoplasmatota archaeon]